MESIHPRKPALNTHAYAKYICKFNRTQPISIMFQQKTMAKASKMVDVEDTVKRWAIEMFKITRSKEQSRIALDDLQFNVNWKRAKIRHSEPDYDDQRSPGAPNTQVLFKTTFTNNTENEQEYSFRTERTTVSTCEVEIEKGVSYGMDLGVSLKLPSEILEVGAGFRRDISLTSTVGECFEETLTWGVDSLVKVPPLHKTTAELVITEDTSAAAFKIRTRLSGRISVHITNIRDNNSFVKNIDGDIVEILKREIADGGLQSMTPEKNCVTYITKGNCSFRYGVEQHVKLSEEPLDGQK